MLGPEVRRDGDEMRAVLGDVGLAHRLGGRRPLRVARGLLEPGADEVVAHGAELARRAFGVAAVHRVDQRHDRLDEAHAGRRVQPMHRDQRKQRRPAPRHRPVRMHQRVQLRLVAGPRRRHLDRGDGVLDQRIEQVLLARKVVVDAHCLAAQALAEPPRAEGGEAACVDEGQRRLHDRLAAQRRGPARRRHGRMPCGIASLLRRRHGLQAYAVRLNLGTRLTP